MCSKLLVASIFVTASCFEALAWGYDAHRITAEIAEQFLEPETARQVHALLAIENVATLAEVSTWADEIRTQRPETRPWHYVNIPVQPPARTSDDYDAVRDCPQDDCVVAKIKEFGRVLADRQAPERQRLEALKYIVHFVADVHQPLHASDDHDRGGNNVPIIFVGYPTNLHAVWDSGIIARAVKGDERGYALKLVREITPAEREQWSQGDPVSWANESHRIAVDAIYGELPHSGLLPAGYQNKALPVVNTQLERAGVRLGNVLNAFLTSPTPHAE